MGQTKLRDDLVERRERTEVQLGPGARGAAVPVDHDAGAVARAVRHPGLGATVRERHRDEGRAKIVDADGATDGAALVEFGALHAGALEVVAELGGELLRVELAALLGEDVVVGLGVAGVDLAPPGERAEDAETERPGRRSCSRRGRCGRGLGRRRASARWRRARRA